MLQLRHFLCGFIWLCGLICCAPVVTAFADSPDLQFERDIRPLLKLHCFHCHGEEPELSGGLDLRLVRLMQSGGDSGAALVAGKHAESPLYQRIAAGEMPPGEKQLTADEVARIARWIDQGARTLRPEPADVRDIDEFTPEERAHWAYQPIRRPTVPSIDSLPATSPIDAFIIARLQRENLTPSPAANRATLIRRLSFDLLGLPPSPEAVERFVNDPRSDAYERLVDELLDSPAYGERWARHWLDVAGYADSDGYSAKDLERKWAWKYRDYVIRAFNDDKPWNEFLVEQLAGDELVPPPYQNLSPDQAEKLIATGFLRMGPDGTGDGSVDQNVARNDAIAETIKIVSTSLLGQTVGCAQCHNHRYDPISQRDYYRIRSIFEPAYDWKNWKAPNARLISQWSSETRQRVAEVDAELAQVQKDREAELDQIVEETLTRELAKLPEELQPSARAARETAAKDRTPEQQQLIKEYPFLNVNRGSVYLYLPDRLRAFNKKWDDLTAEVKQKRPADDLIQCLTEPPGHAPVAKLFSRGDFQQPRDEIPPGELSILNSSASIPLNDPTLPTTGRRLAYARWLTNGEHPLVARVLVNRFWLHHFGRGLVATPGDFGFLGEKPSHPELLDWLASEFMQSGWRLKPLHRLLVTSATYRQTSQHRDDLDAVDPENRLLGRMSVRRLEAEVIRDALLAVSGQLTTNQYGAPVPVMPDDVGQVVVGIDNRDSAGRPSGKIVPLGADEFRRSLYVSVRRSLPLGVLEPFDAPVMTPNCEQRAFSTVAPQSLLMMNNQFVVQQSQALAERLRRETADANEAAQPLAKAAWLAVFGQTPTAEQSTAAADYLKAQIEYFTQHPPVSPPKTPPVDPVTLALSTYCQALFSSNAFLYVD